MPNPIASAPAASICPPEYPPESFAEVRARDHVMRYRRTGAGRVVLVLCAGAAANEPAPLWPELAGALAAHCRLVVPEIPGDAAAREDVAAWLVDFLDGLGLAGVSVVATERFCIPALELALLDSERVARVVLVPAGVAAETGLDGALATTTARASRPVPLLVVRRGLSAADALPLVTRFLAGERLADGAAAG